MTQDPGHPQEAQDAVAKTSSPPGRAFAEVAEDPGTAAPSEAQILRRLARLTEQTHGQANLPAALNAVLDLWVDAASWTFGVAIARDVDGTPHVVGGTSATDRDAWATVIQGLTTADAERLAADDGKTGHGASWLESLSDGTARELGIERIETFPVSAAGKVVASLAFMRADAADPPAIVRQGVELARRHLEGIASRARAEAAVGRAAQHLRRLSSAEGHPAQTRLKALEERYALLCRAAEPGLWDWDLHLERVHWSPRWKAVLGYGAQELTDQPSEWFDRVHPDDADRVELELLEHLDWQSPRFESEHRLLHTDGSYRWVRVRGVAERGESGEPSRIAGSMTDITDSRIRDDRSARDLMYHRLTGLATSSLMVDRVQQAMRRRTRRPDRSFAVLALSLEGLPQVAERVGGEATEEVLLTLARRMSTVVRPGDTVAHSEDFEFGIVLDDVSNTDDAARIVDRLVAVLTQEVPLGSETLTFRPGIGVALSRSAYEEPEEMIRDAGIALRRARREEIPVQIFDSATKAFAQSMAELEGDLRKAFDERQLYIEYQPVVSLGDGRITGVEAFLRWKHPERGQIAPAEFLPVAEEAGLLPEIGYWVTERACRQLREWVDRFSLRFPPNVAINVTESQLFDESFVARTIAAVEASKLDFKLVRLDVSESTFMKDGAAAGRILRSLAQRGIRIAVDDFGTGYSSLSYLHRYPINALKIDRSFVSGSAGVGNEWDVARTIIELSKILELEVIAEGIETRDQFQQLRKLGCQQAQGYFFSGPASAQKTARLIEEGYPLDVESVAG